MGSDAAQIIAMNLSTSGATEKQNITLSSFGKTDGEISAVKPAVIIYKERTAL